jgi:hypothetical protein
VTKDFIFQPPDLTNAKISELNEFQEQISLLLASLKDNQRLQVQFFCDSDIRMKRKEAAWRLKSGVGQIS